jgi:uncharacterized protein YjbI with pentapeptide repeats
MIAILLFFGSMAICSLVYSQHGTPSPKLIHTVNSSQKKIPKTPDQHYYEIEKLKLEISKLRSETYSINSQPWLQLGTLVAAFIAAAISFWSALRSQKYQTESLKEQDKQQQMNRISELLRELGSEHPAVKIAAIQALSEFKAAVPFLVNILKVETNYPVITATITALQKMPEISLSLLLNASREIHEQQLTIACQLHHLQTPKDKVIDLMQLENETFTKWLESSKSKQIKKSLQLSITYTGKFKNLAEPQILESEKNRLMSEWSSFRTALDIIINAIERLIEFESKNNKIYTIKDAYLPGIILDGYNLTEWHFKDSDLRNASFMKTKLQKAKFENVCLSNANFRDAELGDTFFHQSLCKETSFSKAHLIRTTFYDCTGFQNNFNGTKIHKAVFISSELPAGTYQGSTITETNFQDCNLYEADFNSCQCFDTQFINCLLNNSVFHTAKFYRNDFSGSKFYKTIFTKGDFDHSKFNKAQLSEITQFDEASFRDTQWNNPVFGDKTNSFKNYIEMQLSKTLPSKGLTTGQPPMA